MYNPTKEPQEQTSVSKDFVVCSSSSTTNLQAQSGQTTTDLTSPKRLTDKHYTHCCGSDLNKKQRGLNPDWIAANCHSVDIKEATQLLYYPARSGGILIKGANGQYQFRPDQPWSEKQGEKAPKYRTAAGDEYDVLLPAHPTDSYYWLNLEALKKLCYKVYETVYSYTDSEGREILVENPSHPLAQPKVLEIPCLLITEGGFKAICACSEGLPTVALLGVEMGLTSAKSDPQGKRYLVPSLETLAKAGFGFILAFDTDISTKLDVRKALHKLGRQLTKFNSPVYVLPEWDENQGKGIDDYIQMNGIEEFRQQLIAKAIRFKNWELEYERDTPKIPAGYPSSWKANPIALWFVKRYEKRLAWDVSIQEWRVYSATMEGIWSIEPVEFLRQVIYAELEANQSIYTTVKDGKVQEPSITDSLIKNIEALMKYKLAVRTWDEIEGLIPLTNGVLDLATHKLIPHSPEHRLTWCLPYEYNPLALCNPIQDWLKEMCQGDEDLVQLLRAYLHGIVTGRTDWQKYLELIGPGGTGKGTFFRLAIALVGLKNTHTTTLEKLEKSRFETASLKDKRLVVITDSERYTGAVSILKALTGQDPLPYEAKFKQSTGGFIPNALVIVAANETIQSSDYTSGLKRRRITIPMQHQVANVNQKNLLEITNNGMKGDFVPYLSGLLNWVLEMKPDRVTQLVKDYENQVPSLTKMATTTLCDTNPIADWLDQKLLYRQGARSAVGTNDPSKVNDWLYANYVDYSRQTGGHALGLRRFVNLLSDLCNNQLNLNVSHGRDRGGAFFLGLKLRTSYDDDPLLITGSAVIRQTVIDTVDGVTDEVMVETRTSDGCDGCDGLLSNLVEKENKLHSSVTDVVFNKEINKDFIPSHPSQEVAKMLDGDELQPMNYPSQPSSQFHHGDGLNPSQTPSPTLFGDDQAVTLNAQTIGGDELQPITHSSQEQSQFRHQDSFQLSQTAQTIGGEELQPISQPAQSNTKKGFNPSPRAKTITRDELQTVNPSFQVDYSTYPHRTSNNLRAKEKRANKCREAMLACSNQGELAQFKANVGFSDNEIKWVYRNVLTPGEREKVKEAASSAQLNLLELPSYEWDEVMESIDRELIRLGWTKEEARNYLQKTYGVKSRSQLTNEQIMELWQTLKTW